MRFLDANVILYDYLQLKRKLDSKTLKLKESAHKIMKDIKEGKEKVVTTIAHMSEVSNILQGLLTIESAHEVIAALLQSEYIIVESVDKNKYIEGLELAKWEKIEVNDGLAIVIMKNLGISEIYSFDDHFDKIEGIKRVEK